MGLPDIDEVSMMRDVLSNLQSVTNLPLQIDTVDTKAMEAGLRIYNVKAMVNSVSGKQESMDAVSVSYTHLMGGAGPLCIETTAGAAAGAARQLKRPRRPGAA